MKFGAEGLELMPELREIRDHVLLCKILARIETAGSPDDLRVDLDPAEAAGGDDGRSPAARPAIPAPRRSGRRPSSRNVWSWKLLLVR